MFMHLLQCILKELNLLFSTTKVNTSKTHYFAVNTCINGMWQLGLTRIMGPQIFFNRLNKVMTYSVHYLILDTIFFQACKIHYNGKNKKTRPSNTTFLSIFLFLKFTAEFWSKLIIVVPRMLSLNRVTFFLTTPYFRIQWRWCEDWWLSIRRAWKGVGKFFFVTVTP